MPRPNPRSARSVAPRSFRGGHQSELGHHGGNVPVGAVRRDLVALHVEQRHEGDAHVSSGRGEFAAVGHPQRAGMCRRVDALERDAGARLDSPTELVARVRERPGKFLEIGAQLVPAADLCRRGGELDVVPQLPERVLKIAAIERGGEIGLRDLWLKDRGSRRRGWKHAWKTAPALETQVSHAIAARGAKLYGGRAVPPCRRRHFARKSIGPVAQWLEPTAHNGLVGGSSPPGPTNGLCHLFSGPCLRPGLRFWFAPYSIRPWFDNSTPQTHWAAIRPAFCMGIQ